ncbi:bifunctional homocysteine S-methyltransferase/methylenetetrahydrofolate reductase [Granulicella sp. L46]|uniref:bifunctional homocysteine S-methyltransferase/methylenetetrahydrofolate reductase n=1 Tax=Granulicella sp. L46 TaxID=1641865 RepID=UPI00131E17F1|nr:bifunctional homocysteine S-methyltransferase/methylenetetrahydrofolate reductase [Granulicella sp. L46]
MASAVDRLFEGDTVLCDGAMGTMLYSCGVFINRCYDELNVTQAETVRSVHQQYLQAGAEIIETNTFGANSFRLERFGLRDKVSEFNRAGAAIARQCVDAIREKQGTQAFVAGAMGPLGLRLEPLGKTSLEEARAAFAEQIAALAEGGVDLLMLETMMSVDEAEQAVLAARKVAPQLKVVVLFTVDEESNCLDGTSPEVAAQRMVAVGADAVGCNCSTGPAAVLSAVERMRAVTMLPIVAMPNAGMPRNVEGRNIYLTSPEYMGSFARKFVRAGANWVGGCCGTTPAHIRAMRSALRAMEAQQAGETAVAAVNPTAVTVTTGAAREAGIEPPPLRDRSHIGQCIADGKFVTMVEIVPPKGFDCEKELAGAALLARYGVDAINVPDSPRASARMSAQSLCVQIQQKVGIETILHYTCRDRNVLSIQSDLLGAASIGLKNILCLTGDPPKMGNYPDATAVFDVDAIGLVNIVHGLNQGLDIGRNPIGGSTGFTISAAANPGVADIEHEVRRFAYKVEAGAEFCITQPVFDLKLLEDFLRRIEGFRIPVIAGIWPLTSVRNAEFMKNDLRVSMPDEIMARMAAAPDKDAALAEGVAIAREMLESVRGSVQGVQVSAPFGKYALTTEVLGLHQEVK